MEREKLIDLVTRSQQGNMEAIEDLLLYAHTPVSYQCKKMLKNEQDAEDMTQEVLITVYEKLDTLKEPAAFGKWLHQITASRCINALNRTHKELQFSEDEEGNSVLDNLEELDQQKVPDKALDNAETARMINEIVDSLPEAQRICTLLFYYSEMSVKEISQLMSVSENTVKSRLNYARKAIKDKVKDYEKDGIKLYSLSPLPFLFFFLHRSMEQSKDQKAAGIMVDNILAESTAAAGIVGAAAAGSAGAAGISASGAAAVGAALGGAAVAGAAVKASAAGTGSRKAAAAAHTAAKAGKYISAKAAGGSLLAGLSGKVLGYTAAAAVTLSAVGFGAAAVFNQSNSARSLPSAAVSLTQYAEDTTEKTGSGPETAFAMPEETTPAGESLENTAAKQEATPGNATASTGNNANNSSSSGSNSTNPENNSGSGSSQNGNSSTPSDEGNNSTPGNDASSDTPNADSGSNTENSDSGDSNNDPEGGDQVDPATIHTHNYVVYNVWESDCIHSGSIYYSCTVCSEEKREDTPTTDHDYRIAVIPATEEAPGYTLHECTSCGTIYTDNYTDKLPAGSNPADHEHTFVSSRSGWNTCETESILTHTCTICNYVYTEVLPRREHSYDKKEYVYVSPPTCTSDGHISYACDNCTMPWKTEVTAPALGHDYITNVVPPTETAMGYTEFSCSRCDISFVDNYTQLAADGSASAHTHSYTTVTIPPTCGDSGYTTYTCACGNNYTADYSHGDVPHTYEQTSIVPPTETEEGYTVNTCTVCGHYEYTDYVPPLVSPCAHSYIGIDSKTATCVAPGLYREECTKCGDIQETTSEINPNYHTFIYCTITPPTCTMPGQEIDTCGCGAETIQFTLSDYPALGHSCPEGSSTCTRCGETVDPETGLAATDPCHHNYQPIETQISTCSVPGYILFECEKCGKQDKHDLPTEPHSYTRQDIAPTCTTEGYRLYTCTECGNTSQRVTGDALGHDYTDITVPPTATEQGYTEYTCTRCGDSFRDHYTDPVAGPATRSIEKQDTPTSLLASLEDTAQSETDHTHSYTSQTLAPGCTTPGQIRSLCECGQEEIQELDPSGHDYQVSDDPENPGHPLFTCTRCGDSYTEE